MENEWGTAAPVAAGVDPMPLVAMAEWIDRFHAANIHSVLVARRGVLAFERYRKGSDRHWAQALPDFVHGAPTKHDLRSITKSVASLLVGIAIDQGYVASVDDPVFEYFPDYADLRTPEKDRITLRHLLTMSGGFEWNEYIPYTDLNNSERQMLQSADRWRFALTPKLITPPGTSWNYNGGSTELLGAVVSRATGRPIEQYARQVLFAPLGIEDFEWTCYPDQVPAAASGLRLCSRDIGMESKSYRCHGSKNPRQPTSVLRIVSHSMATTGGLADHSSMVARLHGSRRWGWADSDFLLCPRWTSWSSSRPATTPIPWRLGYHC